MGSPCCAPCAGYMSIQIPFKTSRAPVEYAVCTIPNAGLPPEAWIVGAAINNELLTARLPQSPWIVDEAVDLPLDAAYQQAIASSFAVPENRLFVSTPNSEPNPFVRLWENAQLEQVAPHGSPYEHPPIDPIDAPFFPDPPPREGTPTLVMPDSEYSQWIVDSTGAPARRPHPPAEFRQEWLGLPYEPPEPVISMIEFAEVLGRPVQRLLGVSPMLTHPDDHGMVIERDVPGTVRDLSREARELSAFAAVSATDRYRELFEVRPLEDTPERDPPPRDLAGPYIAIGPISRLARADFS